MNHMEFTGKTIEEAVQKALKELDLQAKDITWDVVNEPSRGFLGFGSKEARIRVQKNVQKPVEKVVVPPAEPVVSQEPPEKPFVSDIPVPHEGLPEEPEAAPAEPVSAAAAPARRTDHTGNIEDLAMAFLAPLFKTLDIQPVVRVEENDEEIRFAVDGNHVGLLIGRRGDTLNAIQLLLSVYLRKEMKTGKRIVFDVADYRNRRIDTLEKLAGRMAEKCRTSGRRVHLDPMGASERRTIHLYLEKEPGVSTFSEGDEPYRRIVIVPEKQ